MLTLNTQTSPKNGQRKRREPYLWVIFSNKIEPKTQQSIPLFPCLAFHHSLLFFLSLSPISPSCPVFSSLAPHLLLLPQPQRKDIFIIIFSLLAASPPSYLSPPPAARLIPSHGRPFPMWSVYIYIYKQSDVSHGGSTHTFIHSCIEYIWRIITILRMGKNDTRKEWYKEIMIQGKE